MVANPLNVFFTGATGCVGQAVLSELLATGFGVTTLSRRIVQTDGFRSIVGSLEDVGRLRQEIGACDAILHLACPRSLEGHDVLSQDVSGTAGLIEAWRKGPFVYVSSPMVYGVHWEPITEASSISLSSWYDSGKYANELQLRLSERRNSRGGATFLRPGAVLAVNHRTRDRHILSDIHEQCRSAARFVFDSEAGLALYGCSFVGGADFGRVVAEALTHDLSGPFNVAGGFCTWRELIETINRVAGTKGDFVIRPDTRPQAGEYRLAQSRTELDTTAFQQATGFQPRETLEEIVEAFVRMERAQQPA